MLVADSYSTICETISNLDLKLETPGEESQWSVYTIPIDNLAEFMGVSVLGERLSRLGLAVDKSEHTAELFVSPETSGYNGITHFDALSDVLIVLSGTKVVYLAPPPPCDFEDETGKLSFCCEGFWYKETSPPANRAGSAGGTTVNMSADAAALGSQLVL